MEFSRETLCFGRYRLHPTQGLRLGRREVRITPKSLSVLVALARRPGQVVSKADLFRAAWPNSAVTDATLTSCIKELRRALNDDAQAPRYIETIHRRGFRFLASPVALPSGHVVPESSTALPAELDYFVGRDMALQQLSRDFAHATEGRRQVVFLRGEPGIGKTALADLFQHRISRGNACVIARAECVQHFGPGEAYQPLFEILTRLARSSIRADLLRALRRFAPLWLAQLPVLQMTPEARSLQGGIAGATQQRMLRELTDALEALSQRAPLVLCLEDLHWSDPSTLDWIACFARRPESARVLVLATYRPGEHELPDRLAGELHRRNRCSLVELAPLEEADSVTYILRKFPAAAGDEHALDTLARTVHRRSEGNPLFLVSLLNDLIVRRMLTATGEHWRVQSSTAVIETLLPPDLRQVIAQQLVALEGSARALLDAASVMGSKFSAAAVAAGAGLSTEEAERQLSALTHRGTLVREAGSIEWPDGTVCANFEFLHVLYSDAVRNLLTPARRRELHRAVGLRLEAGFARRAPQIAPELAMHFDQGRDFPRAIRFHGYAAHTNLKRNAHQSAQRHFARALALLDHLEASPERNEIEINLQIGLGNVLMQTGGWAAPEVQAAYARASDLCRSHETEQRLFPALWNLWVFNAASGDLDRAHAIASQLSELAGSSGDPASVIQAHHASWTTLHSMGNLAECATHAADGIRLYELHRAESDNLEYGSHDCGVCARMFNARTLALFGKTAAAAEQAAEGVALAHRLRHPFTRTFALTHAAAIHLELHDMTRCREYGEAAQALAREWHFALLEAWASCYVGASLVRSDRMEDGLAMLTDGIAGARATGSEMFQSHLLGLLADARLRARSAEDGLRTVDDALEISIRTGERFHLAELHRIKGELHLALSANEETAMLARREFRRAMAVARGQGASVHLLRASSAFRRLQQAHARASGLRAVR